MPRTKFSPDNTYQTSLRLPKDLYAKIEKLAEQSERVPAEQIRYMLKKYIELQEAR